MAASGWSSTRNGRATVRLPNGSKTTVDYDGLRPIGGSAHVVRASKGVGESGWCNEVDCDWTTEAPSRVAAEDAYVDVQSPAASGS